MDELKACPFCEGEAEYGACQIDYPPQNCQAYIRCLNCKAEIHSDGRISDIHKLKQRIFKLWNRRPSPSTAPLTLDELRKMDGEPVWVVPNKGVPKWYLVDVANDACETCDMDVVDFELYGPENKSYGWLAYRRKSEDDAK